MKRDRRIVCIGECMLEFSEHGAGNFKLGFAGDTFNTAWYLRACLGADWAVDYVTAVGDDHYSAQMLFFCQANKIGTDHIKAIPNHRQGLYVIRQADGDRHFTYWRGQAAAKKLADDIDFLNTAFEGVRLIYFSGITLAILDDDGRERLLAAVELAKAKGSLVAFDPNERPALWASKTVMTTTIEQAAGLADFVLPTFPDEQLHFSDKNPEAVAMRYLKLGVPEVVVKNGADAALVATSAELNFVSPHGGVTAVDPTGAGDSFNGAYLAARLQNILPPIAAAQAHVVAGVVITQPGALVPMERFSGKA